MKRMLKVASLALVGFLGSQGCFAQTSHTVNAQRVDESNQPVAQVNSASSSVASAEHTKPQDAVEESTSLAPSNEDFMSLPDKPKPHVRAWKELTFMGQLATGADVASTMTILKQGGYEADPLAKPFVNLPRPAYSMTAMVLTSVVSYAGMRMQESKRFHRIWWVPQVLQIAANSTAAARNSVIMAYSSCHQQTSTVQMPNGQIGTRNSDVCGVF